MIPTLEERISIYGRFSSWFSFPQESPELIHGSDNVFIDFLLTENDAPTTSPSELVDWQELFTNTFINRLGGIAAPAYGSVYLDAGGELYGKSTDLVEQLYTSAGIQLDNTVEPPDYLSTELEFMYYLLSEEAASDNAENIKLWQGRQRQFFLECLAPWVFLFCEKLQQDHDSGFYQWAVTLLEKFSRMEMELYSIGTEAKS